MCPLVTGNMSRNAYVSSSSYILFDLVSPEIILRNRHSIISVFVLELLSFLIDCTGRFCVDVSGQRRKNFPVFLYLFKMYSGLCYIRKNFLLLLESEIP